MKQKIVYIIGHRSCDPYRVRNLLLVIKWLINNKRPEALKREEKEEEPKNKAPKRNKQKKMKIIKQSVDLKLCESMLEAKSRNEPNKEKSKKLN